MAETTSRRIRLANTQNNTEDTHKIVQSAGSVSASTGRRIQPIVVSSKHKDYEEKYANMTRADVQKTIERKNMANKAAGIEGETEEIKWLKNYEMNVGYSNSASYESEIQDVERERTGLIIVKRQLKEQYGSEYAEKCKEFEENSEKRMKELNAKIDYLGRRLKEVQAAEAVKENYEPFTQAVDFEAKAVPNNEIDDPLYQLANHTPWTGSGFDYWRLQDDLALYDSLEDDEKKLYLYLANEKGIDIANQYFDTMRPILNARKNKTQVESVQKFADSVHVLDDTLTLGTKLVDGMIMAPKKFIGGLTGDYEDNWATYDTLSTFTNTIRTDTAQDLSKAFNSEAAGFVYNTVMSVGDMVASILVSRGLGSLAGAGSAASGAVSSADAIEKVAKATKTIAKFVMASEAATQTMTRAREQGLSGLQISGIGLASASIEWLTEKYSLDALLADPKHLIPYVIKNMGTEAAEEATSNVLNLLADEVIAGNQSQIKQEIGNLMARGTSYEDATQQVLLGKLKELGLDALGGALSGGIMSGGRAAYTNITTAVRTGSEYLKHENGHSMNEAIRIGLSNAKSTDAYRAAKAIEAKYNKKDPHISAYEVGRMVIESSTPQAARARQVEALVLQSAQENGLNPESTMVQEVAFVASRFGRPVRFVSDRDIQGTGEYDPATGVISLNSGFADLALKDEVRAQELLNEVIKHELAHSVERTKLGQQLEQIVRSSMGAEFDAAVQAKLAEYQNYGKKLDEPGARHEVVAQWLGNNLYQNGFAQAVVNGDAKVGNVILRALDQARLALGGTQKSRTAANIAIVERLFMRALQQSPALDNSGGVQYSLGNLPQKYNNNTQNSDISEETMYNNKWASYELTAEFVTKVPYDERHAFLRSLANKTNGMKQGECKSIIIFTDKHVYFYEATGYMDGSIEEVLSVGSKKVKAKIKAWGDISDSSDANATTLDSWAQTYGSIKGRNGGYNATNGYTEETGRIDNVDDQKQDGNSFGYNWGSDEDFSGVEEVIPGSFVFTDDGRSFKVNDDGTTEDIQFSNIETEYANTKSFEESPPSQDGAGFFDAQNSTQSSFEGSDEIAEAVALMERERAEKSTAQAGDVPLTQDNPSTADAVPLPLDKGGEGTVPATNIPSPLESGRVSESTMSRAQTVDELTAEIGDEAAYRRMYYAAQIDRPPATLDIDGRTVNTTAYMDELYVALPDDDLQLTAYLKEREAEKAAQVAERFARGETDAEWTEVDLQILTARSKLEWSELGDSGESGSKTRLFYEQRLKGRDVNKAHEEELLEILAGRSETYSPIANVKTLEKAQNKLRNAEYQTALRKRILRYKPNDLFNAVDAAAAQVMINDARNDGDLELYADLVQGLSRKGTELGRAVQVLSMQRRMTPEGTLKAAQRTLRSQADRAMYDGANEDLDVFAEQITDAIERAAENKVATTSGDDQRGGESVRNPMTRDELTEALAQDITGDNSPYITADEIRGILERAVESASDIPDQLKRYLKKRLGSDMGTLAQRIAKLHEAGHLNDMTMRRVMEETLHLPTLTDEDVKTLTGLVNALNDAPEGSAQQLEATEDIYRFLGEKLIVTKLDTLQSWRKFGMLFNAKTHLRNFGSNAVFAGVDRIDGAMATWLERVLIPEAEKRTAAFGWSFTEQGQQIRPAIEKSLEQALLKMRGQGQKYEVSNGVLNQYRKAFGKNKFGETLNTLNEKNSQLLEWEDAIFFKAAYTNALGQIMVARGLTEVNSDVENIAYKRAVEAVFRGENAMTNVLASIKRYQNSTKLGHALFGHAVDVAIPFSKTPANIAYQAVEHSPIGLVKGAWDILQVTRGKSPKTMAEAINLTSKGFTGTVLLRIGMLLGSLGLFVTGFGKTEKERAADELAGIQENAFRFGNVTISLDWLQPAASPLIVGASIAQRLKEDGLSLGSVFGATFDGTDSLFEMTMLQSLYDVLGGYEAGASASVASVAENLLSQSVPTVLGQVARAVDPVQRKTNGESTLSPIIGNGTFAKVVQRVLARIPGLTYLLEPELDVWGNTVYRTGKASTMSGVLNALQQFILPANVKIATGDDEISQIVMELYNSDEEQPGRALPTAITREKAAELGVSYEDVNRLLGQNQHAALLAVLSDREKYTVTNEITRGGKTVKQKRQKYWSDMTDEERLQVLKKVYQAEKDNITDPDGEYYDEIVRRMN